MKKYAVIVAGGAGLRMGSSVPKQFLLVRDKPVLWYTLNVFLEAYEDLELILVLPEEHLEVGRRIIYTTTSPHRIRMTIGGPTRFHSVKYGLQLIDEPESLIFVHDGVRCLLTTRLVRLCGARAMECGSAVPVIDSKDSVRLVSGSSNEAIERSRVKLVQTPQTFLGNILLPAYQQEYQERFTDEASVVEAYNGKVQLVEGEINNIKITTPLDLLIAEQLLI
jgi:2-C-methyl-D-erythritol 4-phosphate cytidylyltransferase